MARIPREESAKVHDAIVRATVAEMAQHGYAGLRVNAVAKRVGKTQGAIYARFADKEALALAAIRSIRDESLVPAVVEAVQCSESAIDALEGMSAAVAAIAANEPDGQRVVSRLAIELADDAGPLAEETRRLFESFATMLSGLVARGQKEGLIRADLDVHRFTHAVLGIHVAFAAVAGMFPDQTRFEHMEATMREVLTRGISSDSASRKKRR